MKKFNAHLKLFYYFFGSYLPVMLVAEEIKSKLLSDPLDIFNSMLHDIENAHDYIFIETYKWGNDPIGIKFRNLLTKKSKQGVKVRLLIDSWGSYVSEAFFNEMIQNGAQVKMFKKIRYSINLFSANHERDHRKLLIIDDRITHLSSLNFTNYNLNWRELSLRIEGTVAKSFKTVFQGNYNLKNTYKFDKLRHTRLLHHGSFLIIRDVPSVVVQKINRKYQQMIKKASTQIILETPYFLPARNLREALTKAAKRGVDIKVYMPYRSDVRMANILREYYLGKLYQSGIRFYFYLPDNLHSKFMIVDNQFMISTANFDYRSFRYQFEVGLYGNDDEILKQLHQHNEVTASESVDFDYNKWKNRGLWHRIKERALVPIRHFL
jgi:cardiolipin synthase